ncbi:MAG TPA: cation transporter [Chloroflexota bacterium]|nr:cation transporter [Chloroflexota bacterium]
MTAEARAADIRRGVHIEVVTVIWMVIEAAVSLGAGIVAGSILLTAFGLDSVIELISGSVLLWRLSIEAGSGDTERAERVEHVATWVVVVTLALLCVYVLVSSIYGLATHAKPESSPVGIAVSIAAVIVMPYLAFRKRTIAGRIDSEALEGDAAESITCAYMAGTVLVGLALNALFGWWWAEDIAALVFLFWLGRETWEAFEEARKGGDERD